MWDVVDKKNGSRDEQRLARSFTLNKLVKFQGFFSVLYEAKPNAQAAGTIKEGPVSQDVSSASSDDGKGSQLSNTYASLYATPVDKDGLRRRQVRTDGKPPSP